MNSDTNVMVGNAQGDIPPTIFHITHRKAGSQWIAEILKHCAPARFVSPEDSAAHFFSSPIKSGAIYPAVYAAKPDFDGIIKGSPHPYKKFVVIRDLRDTLISEYFSLKYSHPLLHEWYRRWRAILTECDLTQGLLALMDEILPIYAEFQRSWIDTDVWLIQYEELLRNEFVIFEKMIAHCQITMSQRRLSDIVGNNSFEMMTGRRRGQEDVQAHQRKGIHGDWQNHFSTQVTELFKQRFGQLLIKAGYEIDLNWQPANKPLAHSASIQAMPPTSNGTIEEPCAQHIGQLREVTEQRFQLLCQQKDALLAKERSLQILQGELIGKEAIIQAQQRDLLAKEAVIQQFIATRQSFIRCCQINYLYPALKKLLPDSWQTHLRAWRRHVQPKLDLTPQYAPRPLRLPSTSNAPRFTNTDAAPVIAIVTPSFNQGQFLERTLTSVLQQNYSRLEYVVQDGASTDGSRDLLAQYRHRLTHLESCCDNGQAHAINNGFRKTTGDIMAWLNSDDLFFPGALADVAQFFLTHPDVDVVYSHRIILDEWGQEIGRWILPPHDDDLLLWADYIPQETLFWRRQIWEKAGGYVDESFHFALDWELLLRFREAGAKFVRLPRFVGGFRYHQQSKTAQELEDRGSQEMYRLRERLHGRHVSHEEAHAHIRPYLRKQIACHWLDRCRILRY